MQNPIIKMSTNTIHLQLMLLAGFILLQTTTRAALPQQSALTEVAGHQSHLRYTESSAASSPSSSSGDLPSHGKCEPITISICKDIPYNATIMPNMLGHTRQEEAGLELNQFAPLVKIDCSPDLQFFLCLVYVPLCTILDHPIPPCRPLCESARICENVMRSFNFEWPENLECSKFPESGSGELCVAQNTSDTQNTSGDGSTSTGSVGGGPSSGSTRLGGDGFSSKVVGRNRNGVNGGVGGVTAGPHRNIRFVCPVQLKTPSGLGYSLTVAGEVSFVQ